MVDIEQVNADWDLFRGVLKTGLLEVYNFIWKRLAQKKTDPK